MQLERKQDHFEIEDNNVVLFIWYIFNNGTSQKRKARITFQRSTRI